MFSKNHVLEPKAFFELNNTGKFGGPNVLIYLAVGITRHFASWTGQSALRVPHRHPSSLLPSLHFFIHSQNNYSNDTRWEIRATVTMN